MTNTAMEIARKAAEINFDIDPYNGMGFDGTLVSYYTQLNSGDIEAMIDDLNWMAEEEPSHAEECKRLIEQAEAFAAEPVTLESVAAALNDYAMDNSPYEYRDCFETEEEGLAYHIETLKNDSDYVIESLKLDLEGAECSPEDYAVITQLLHDVRLVALTRN